MVTIFSTAIVLDIICSSAGNCIINRLLNILAKYTKKLIKKHNYYELNQ
jgi:hypothetical protein